MNGNLVIESTADGSHTLYIPDLDEHYHSVNGAIQESQHVFIEAGLKQFSKDELRVLEVGLGTGLNAYLSLIASSSNNQSLCYTALELYPLDSNFIHQLNYPLLQSGNAELFYKIHRSSWNTPEKISDRFSLLKIKTDFSENYNTVFREDELFDLIYYDAFAPDKQPDMWTQDIFDYLYQHTATAGIIVTYCAKGEVRRMMQRAGYKTERLPGPPGKREMLRGRK